ncbi:hypothetical protein L7F22_047592 [Adiantum nelumboides]|nr:hypothetical protein [Adiantum nelumboides]
MMPQHTCGPYTIISSLAISIVVGWGYLLGITFAVTDLDHIIDPGNDANGNAIAQVFYDAFKNRFGSGIGGIFCLGVVALAVFFSGMGAITATSRIIYGFSRDEAMPLSRHWHLVNRWEVPLNAVWLCTTISFLLAMTVLFSYQMSGYHKSVLSILMRVTIVVHMGSRQVSVVMVTYNGTLTWICVLKLLLFCATPWELSGN